MNDDDRWLEIAGLILDGQPVAWDTIPGDRPPDAPSADALRVIAEVADLHREPASAPVRRWGTLAIHEQIGHGTFGDVYRARDAALDRDVALKLVDAPPSTTGPDEGRLLARVRHSNVVTVHGAALHDGRYGIWMEFIRGRTLAAVVRADGPLSVEDVTAIGIDVCRALTAVHASGLLHGDIKPQNVMREEGGRIVVMDFGTGRLVTDGDAGDRLAGTPLYLAPEVLTGATPDVRADVYSVGVLLYYLLTGAHPVEGSTLDEVRAAHASGARTPVRSRRPEMPRSLAAVIERAIAVEPTDRFESTAAFERALRESSAPRAPLFSKRDAALIAVGVVIARAFGKRHVALIVVSALILGALLAGGYWLLFARIDVEYQLRQVRLTSSDGKPQPLLPALTQVGSPSASADGRLLVYSKRVPNGYRVVSVDVATADERAVTTMESSDFVRVVLSGDGKYVVYSASGHVGYRMNVNTGEVQMICVNCGWPTHVNFDGSAALFESGEAGSPRGSSAAWERERLIEWSGGRGLRPLVRSPDPRKRLQFAGRFSPDGRWVAFCAGGEGDAREIVVVPNAPERNLRDDEWISISDGHTSDREPFWSPDGKLLFFISDRDGFRCIWMRDVDPETGRPRGPAVPVAHFHDARVLLRGPTASTGSIGLTATANALLFTVALSSGNIWWQQSAR